MPSTGEYRIAHIGVWPGGRAGESPLLVGRVGRPFTSGCRAYVFRVVPLKKLQPPRGAVPALMSRCRIVLVLRLPVGGPSKEGRVYAGSLRADGRCQVTEGAGTPPPSVPGVLVAQRSEAQRCEAMRSDEPRAQGVG